MIGYREFRVCEDGLLQGLYCRIERLILPPRPVDALLAVVPRETLRCAGRALRARGRCSQPRSRMEGRQMNAPPIPHLGRALSDWAQHIRDIERAQRELVDELARHLRGLGQAVTHEPQKEQDHGRPRHPYP
jgi:hypothetical protein